MPLAAPLIVAGLRISAVQVVATATLAALVAGGGLGRFIVDGFAQGNDPMIVGGAVVVAALSVVTELAFGLVERVTTPAHSRRGIFTTRTRRMELPHPGRPGGDVSIGA
jgi:osmoprotectant transport system permease protein